jgi:predicted acetyltransferase
LNLTFGPAGPDDALEWTRVVRGVYGGPTDAPAEPRLGRDRYLVRADGRAVSGCNVWNMTLARGADDLTCGGVAAVATLPEARGQGAARRLMVGVLEAGHAAGQAVSLLYPYRQSYYSRFGYATCGWRWQVKCPAHRLPAVRSSLPVREVAAGDVANLNPVYDAFVRRRSGGMARSPEEWQNRLGQRSPHIYAVGEPAQGYLWCNLAGFWEEVEVGEMAWSTHRGYEALLGLVRDLAENQRTAAWCEPPDSPYLSQYLDEGATLSVHRPTMARIVSAADALRSLRPEGSGEFTMAIDDPLLAGNRGPWRVAWSGGSTTVEPAAQGSVQIGVPELSQAVMGSPSFAESWARGLVRADADVAESASRFFGAMPVVCMEFF